jgi:hypothetical protein
MANTMNCPECHEIATEFRTALFKIMSARMDHSHTPGDVHAMITQLFSSEQHIARLMVSAKAAGIRQGYQRWTDHRFATGHVASTLWSSAD